MAQVLLRAGDLRYQALMDAVARLATSTGQWPEAIHPRTLGGCMGDGQHVWAAAEWVLMLRNCFLREEADRLILAGGIPQKWLTSSETMFFGPALTRWGPVSVTVQRLVKSVSVSWEGSWRGPEPKIEVRLPAYNPILAEPGQTRVEIDCESIPCASS